MIILRAKLVEKRPLDISRDAWREITRGAHEDVGKYWVANMLEGHFNEGAGQKYRYKFRSKAYNERKDRNFAARRPMQKGAAPVIAGSGRPNVLTGRMMQDVLSQNTVRGFPSRATVTLYGPQYLNTRFYKKVQPDKGKEITTVTSEEAKILSRVLRDSVKSRLENHRATRTTS
jgi:hypothetical protein